MSLFRAIHQSQLRIPAGNGSQLTGTLVRLRQSVHAGSTVVLLSDFHRFDDAAHSALGGALQSLDVMAVHICDPLDVALPAPGRYPITATDDSEHRRLIMRVGSRADQQRYHDAFQARKQTLQELFTRHRHYYTTAMTDGSLLDTAGSIISRQPLPRSARKLGS